MNENQHSNPILVINKLYKFKIDRNKYLFDWKTSHLVDLRNIYGGDCVKKIT